MSGILSKVVHNKGGLYNRLTEQISLSAFSLEECERMVQAQGIVFTRSQILQYYMIFGGIPYYWTFLEKGLSLAGNIDNILFSEYAPLKDEFKYLYASIFRNPTVHLKIIRTLAKKKIGMTREELINTAGITNSGDLSVKLEELESCGFIRKYNSYGAKKKNAIYQLIDCFTLFYYRFLENRPSDTHFWSNQFGTPSVNVWHGLAFERACLLHIDNIKKKLGISGVYTEVRSWLCRRDDDIGVHGSQIDLLLVRNDQVINICEIKYSEAEYVYSRSDNESMKRKIRDFQIVTGTKSAIHPILITCMGVAENPYAGELQTVITLEDLFQG